MTVVIYLILLKLKQTFAKKKMQIQQKIELYIYKFYTF